MPGHDHHDHADREHHDVGVLLHEARDVVGVEQAPVGEHLEEQDDDEQSRDDAVLADVAAEVLPDGVHRTVTPLSMVM
ncbi:Uncharacterised protein [Mycobacteroides abscessus]|nr:Uncharacterised protein [Mycobacteroides abscessus]